MNSEISLESKECKNWYIFYTCPRAEKKVYQDLISRNYDVFLPMLKKSRCWKNRQKKIIHTPLFPSYIFVNTILSEVYKICKFPKIATYIRCGDSPSRIPIKDIESVRKMLSLEIEVNVEPAYYNGELVKIITGPLAGLEGKLLNQKGLTRFGIELKEINYIVTVDIRDNIVCKI